MSHFFEFIIYAGALGGFIFLAILILILAQEIIFKINELKKWGRK